ncbi:MAG: YceI family protein [Bacteroidia bacterium]|nr:YceI family protein [Bacteroidia bacterium]
MKKTLIFGVAIILLASCSANKSEDKNAETENVSTETVYAYQRAFTTLEWTAYKTSAKVGVKGSFDEFNVTTGVETGTPKELMNQLEFSIPVSTTNSGNEIRDPKIIESFFGTMMNTENITGKFTSISGNDSAGTTRIAITMNDVEHEVDGSYTIDGNEITLTTDLNLGDWKAEPSVASLNEVCSDLHKGEDGSSVLWPDVNIVITSKLKPIKQAVASNE